MYVAENMKYMYILPVFFLIGTFNLSVFNYVGFYASAQRDMEGQCKGQGKVLGFFFLLGFFFVFFPQGTPPS